MVAQAVPALKHSPWWRSPSDRAALVSLVVFALLFKVIILLQHPILARDGIQHLRFAYDLIERPWAATLREHPYHPGYALTLAVASLIFQVFDPGALTPSEWQWCAHLSSSLAGILLILPLYGLARCFYSIRTAWLASLLFLMLPMVVMTTTDALSESWYLLFMFAALWTLVHGVRSQRSSWFIMTGLLTGAAYLVRVEALLIPASLALWMIVSRWQQSKLFPSTCGLRNFAILSACFLLPPLPYMVTIGKFSNRPAVQTVVQNTSGISPWTGPEHLFAAQRLQNGVNGMQREFVHWYEAVQLVASVYARAGHYFLWPLAFIGLLAIWRTRRHDPAFLLLAAVCLLNLGMLFRLAYKAGYASERHTLLLVALAAQAAAIGIVVIGQWLRRSMVQGRWGRHLTTLLTLPIVLLCLPGDVKPLHRHQEAHRQAGLWLADHLQNHRDWLVDPYTWASFYAGLSFQSRSPSTDPRFWMGVIDPSDNDLNRLRDWREASLLSKDAKTVWSWPHHGQPKLIIKQVQMNGLGAAFSF